jgi:general stress protein 26
MSEPENTAENAAKIWKAAESIRTAMLVTRGAEGLTARPMSAIVRGDESTIWFLTDAQSGKIADIEAHPQVSVTFCDGASTHVAFRGNATVHTDRATVDMLWSKPALAFYPDGPGDPNIRVLRIRPDHAELWNGPGTLVAMIKIATAAITKKGVRDMGEHVEAEI